MDVPITVILPVRNGAAYIHRAIESVLTQSFGGVQLLVSDNGSTDNTREIVKEYSRDPRVRLVCQTEKFDIVDHFNKCLDMVNTEFYMLLCHDDYLCDVTAFEKAHNVLLKNPDISAVYCDMVFVDKSDHQICKRKFGREGLVDCDSLLEKSIISARNLFVIPLLIRTSAKAGVKYDKHLPYAADLDFSAAISKHGTIYHLRDQLIANRYHGRNASVSLFKLGLTQMQLIADKHDIHLSHVEKFYMMVNAWIVSIKKWFFFKYLEKVRKC